MVTSFKDDIINKWRIGGYPAPLHEDCMQHHGQEGDPGVTPGICGAIGKRTQVILVWVNAPCVENASHLWRLRVTRARP